MERGRFYQQFDKSGSGEAGSARQFVTDLMQRQHLNVGDIGQYYDKWVQLASEIHGYVPAETHETVKKVGLGLGFLFYNQWAETGYTGRSKQVAFQKSLQRERNYFGSRQLELTYEQGQILRDAAAAVNMAYDPGGHENTPENRKKRTFVFDDLAGMRAATTIVVDAEK